MTEPVAKAPQRNGSRSFRSAAKIKLAPDHARRQGDITRLALEMLGSSEAAINLLNTVHDGLGARPLDLATASNEGFAAVAQVIRGLADPAPAEL